MVTTSQQLHKNQLIKKNNPLFHHPDQCLFRNVLSVHFMCLFGNSLGERQRFLKSVKYLFQNPLSHPKDDQNMASSKVSSSFTYLGFRVLSQSIQTDSWAEAERGLSSTCHSRLALRSSCCRSFIQQTALVIFRSGSHHASAKTRNAQSYEIFYSGLAQHLEADYFFPTVRSIWSPL